MTRKTDLNSAGLPIDKLYIVRYNVRYMLQIISISDARNNFSKLIQTIKDTKKPVVIV